MSSDGSVAPKERINIVYKPATGNAQQEIELPLKLVVIGDFSLRQEEQSLEARKSINISKDNFNDVLRGFNLNLNFTIKDQLSGSNVDAEVPVNLQINSMADFSPDNVARQVPSVNRLFELRDALMALKGPLGNVPAFRRALESIISDNEAREKFLEQLKIGSEDDGKGKDNA